MISKYSITLLAISIADLVFTIALISNGLAEEGNPIMDYVLREYGFVGMSVCKIAMTAMAAAFMECYSSMKGSYRAYKGVLWLYVIVYIVFSLILNLGRPL